MKLQPSEHTCDTCQFFSDSYEGVGRCRRYAPRPFPQRLLVDPETGELEEWHSFPIVHVDSWCGEFQLSAPEAVDDDHAVLDLRSGRLDGWYFDRPRSEMEDVLTHWREKLGHSDLVIISKPSGEAAAIRLALNDLGCDK